MTLLAAAARGADVVQRAGREACFFAPVEKLTVRDALFAVQ
nr:MAG TPA: hypothetical protein [Caudoviricetes sp.]